MSARRFSRWLTIDAQKYRCEKTNFDTHIGYARLDAWVKFPDFQQRIAGMILARQALDRILTGFNGAAAKPDTDITQNPMLQDVNIGWLQQYRDHAPERVLGKGDKSEHVVIGKNGDYVTLDAAI